MTHATAIVEPIASDPVIIDASDARKSAGEKSPATLDASKNEDNASDNEDNTSDAESIVDIIPARGRIPGPPPPGRVRRCRSPIYWNPNVEPDEIPIINNTKQFNAILSESDICIETTTSTQAIYLTTHPFHAADLEDLSWIFRISVPDAWVEKPSSAHGSSIEPPVSRRSYNDYDDGYRGPDRNSVSLARLGAALKIFKDDSEKYGTAKVKFVTAVQGKRNAGVVKLVVSYTRQAAAVDVFHELLNGYPVLFVGAVLQSVPVPAKTSVRKPVKVVKVNSVKEAEEVGKGIIGVIC